MDDSDMRKDKETKEDGRYIIYYSFEDNTPLAQADSSEAHPLSTHEAEEGNT